MKICIIFHSHTGTTKGVCEKVRDACGGDLVEVRPKTRYSKMGAYFRGTSRARKGEADPVEPERIDVSGYDLLVVGTPIWAWKATPVINGAIAVLAGCEGKKAVIFVTCGAKYGTALEDMKEALGKKGVTVTGEIAFNSTEVKAGAKINDLVALVKAAGVPG